MIKNKFEQEKYDELRRSICIEFRFSKKPSIHKILTERNMPYIIKYSLVQTLYITEDALRTMIARIKVKPDHNIDS
jgi:hypothetical protein